MHLELIFNLNICYEKGALLGWRTDLKAQCSDIDLLLMANKTSGMMKGNKSRACFVPWDK